MRTIVQRFNAMQDLNETAAEYIVAAADRSVTRDGGFFMALSGGRTPRGLYELLATEPWRRRIAWDKTWIYLVDERAVPDTHPDSNYAMIRQALLDRVPIPPAQVFPMMTGLPLAQAADNYEKNIMAHVPLSSINGRPVFDVLLMGVGRDGHTASLFPMHPLLQEKEKYVCAVPEAVGDPAWPRLTMALPLINNARSALFLVVVNEKRLIVESILERLEQVQDRYPAARVKPTEERVWLLDTELT
ncbi:MAG TPA: 6-phosphogluconolactonase [Verrucomicrobia bacterium]|nr:MAG: 6-phosphogluconolactonase [Lentisphaerae bacterium GWF2_57_35]HBA83124.1 6-phosphogluconolactonase [Verrucomicrobiota bacterium]